MWLLIACQSLLIIPWYVYKSEVHLSRSGLKQPTIQAALSGFLGLIISTVTIVMAFWPFTWWQPIVAAIISSLVAGILGTLLGRLSFSGELSFLSLSAGAGIAWRIFS